MSDAKRTFNYRKSLTLEVIIVLVIMALHFSLFFLFREEILKGKLVFYLSGFLPGVIYFGIPITLVYFYIQKWSLHLNVPANVKTSSKKYKTYQKENIDTPIRVYSLLLLLSWLLVVGGDVLLFDLDLQTSIGDLFAIYLGSFTTVKILLMRLFGAAALCVFSVGGLSFKTGIFSFRPLAYNEWMEKSVTAKVVRPSLNNNTRSLIEAAGNNDFDEVKEMITKGANINGVGIDKNEDNGEITPLSQAASVGNLEMVKFLMEKGALANLDDDIVNTPLHCAYYEENYDIVKFLLEKGADFSPIDYDSAYLFEYAIGLDDPTIATLMLELGADPNYHRPEVLSPLRSAIAANHYDLVKMLIEKGANINEKDAYGFFPLYGAVTDNHPKFVKLLLDKGARVRNNEHDAFEIALNDGWNAEIVETFLKTGINPNKKNKYGISYFGKAVISENPDYKLMDLFFKHCKDLNGEVIHEKTALLYAMESGNNKLLDYLIMKGLNPDAPNDAGITPLLFAVSQGDTKIIDTLLEKGADIDAFLDSVNPLFMAVSLGNIEVINHLISKGARKNISTPSGVSIVEYAEAESSEEIVKLLGGDTANSQTPDKDSAEDTDVNLSDEENAQIANQMVSEFMDTLSVYANGEPTNFKEFLIFSKDFLQNNNNGLNYIEKLQELGFVKKMEDSSTGLGISIELSLGFAEIMINKDEKVSNLSLAATGEGVWTVVKDMEVLSSPEKVM